MERDKVATLPFPTPPQSREPSPAAITIPAEINAATRKSHTELNRLIIERLPLCLPPVATNPDIYGCGIVAFAQIYFTFEDAWDIYINHLPERKTSKRSHKHELDTWLASLRPDGLQRSRRILNDLRALGYPDHDAAQLAEWKEHIEATFRTRPHTLVAYAWVMYMAIFSGGRWIRSQFEAAGPEYWASSSGYDMRRASLGTVEKSQRGRSFLYFDGSEDGEDMKAAFKTRLAKGEEILAKDERDEIIGAAQDLFETCISLIRKLDMPPRNRPAKFGRIGRSLLPVVGLLRLCARWNL